MEREELEGDALEALVRADRAWDGLPKSERRRYSFDRVAFLRMFVRRRVVDALRSREGKHLKKLAGRTDGTQWEQEVGGGLSLAEVVPDPSQDTEVQALARVRMSAERPPRHWVRRKKKRDLVARHGGTPLAPGELETLADAAGRSDRRGIRAASGTGRSRPSSLSARRRSPSCSRGTRRTPCTWPTGSGS